MLAEQGAERCRPGAARARLARLKPAGDDSGTTGREFGDGYAARTHPFSGSSPLGASGLETPEKRHRSEDGKDDQSQGEHLVHQCLPFLAPTVPQLAARK